MNRRSLRNLLYSTFLLLVISLTLSPIGTACVPSVDDEASATPPAERRPTSPKAKVASAPQSPPEANVASASEPPALVPGQKVRLPLPRTGGGMPLMEALSTRKTVRRFSDRSLSLATISNLLWAGFGVNRPESGKRTAPTARDMREIDLYVALPQGLYLYDAEAHELRPEHSQDIRAITGKQRFTATVPLSLIYVADFDRMEDLEPERKDFYATVDTGFISQNVYLFCASEKLATVVIGYLDRAQLSAAMKLRPQQKVILSQAVGYPAR